MTCQTKSILSGSVLYVIIRLLVVVIPIVIAQIVLLLIIILIKFAVHVTAHALELAGLAGKPVDGARDELFLDVLTELVIEFQPVLDVIRILVVLIKVGRGLRRGEEVEEAFCWDGSLYNTGLFRVFSNLLVRVGKRRENIIR